MAFIETRLSDDVAYAFRAIPRYKTQIAPLDNGKEQRDLKWTKAKRRFEAVYDKFTPTLYAGLLDCFHACGGSGYAFRFKDWSDYQVTAGALGNTPGVNMTPVQLVKVYAFGSQSRSRTITKPVAGTVTVYSNGVAKAGAIDTATGLFTPTTNWAAGEALTATFEFDVPVRFENDELPTEYEDYAALSVDAVLIEVFL